MRYVALGDLVADCYYKNIGQEKELIKIDGGSSRFNVIANLAARGNSTCVISGCGCDKIGKIVLNSLMKLNVDTTFVIRNGIETRAYHITVEGDKHICTRTCPICGKKTWYDKPIVTTKYCRECIKQDDVLILDGLKPENIPIITTFSNEKVLDIGRTKRLVNLSNQDILDILQNRNIEILQLNESVEQYLMQRFGVENLLSLFNMLGPKFMIVTRGKEGADFVVKNHIIHKTLIHCQREIDDTGAGDAFFSMFIQKYYENDKKVTRQWLDGTFFLANKLTTSVVSHLGARGHLYDGYYPDNIDKCICKIK